MAAKRTKTKTRPKSVSKSASTSTSVSALSLSSGGGTTNKLEATVQPVRLQSELINPWDRDIDLEDGYRGLAVEVLSREDNLITFTILTGGVGGEYTVNLDDGVEVWGSLPSTAQRVDTQSSQRTGYLFVTPDWMSNNGVTLADLPKWPRIQSI